MINNNININTIPSDAIIYIGAKWCGPCKQMKPLAESSNKEIYYIDADENQELISNYNVRSIPTLIVLKDGKELKRSSGSLSKIQFDIFLN